MDHHCRRHQLARTLTRTTTKKTALRQAPHCLSTPGKSRSAAATSGTDDLPAEGGGQPRPPAACRIPPVDSHRVVLAVGHLHGPCDQDKRKGIVQAQQGRRCRNFLAPPRHGRWCDGNRRGSSGSGGGGSHAVAAAATLACSVRAISTCDAPFSGEGGRIATRRCF